MITLFKSSQKCLYTRQFFLKFQVFKQQIRQARNITYKTNVFTYKESSNVIISSTIFLCWFHPRYDKRTACYIIKIVFRILKHFQSQYQVPFGKQFGFCCINRSTLTVISKYLNYWIASTGLRSIFHNFKYIYHICFTFPYQKNITWFFEILGSVFIYYPFILIVIN